MKYQLLISGTPGDYESFPKGDEHASEYCKQFFNLPSNDIYHSVDYYIELFPMDKLAYYTLMHRKNVSSTRENAYLALTLKFTGCYIDDVKSVFSLLETIYNNYVLGNVIDITGAGEKYKCQSLALFESLRNKAEAEMGASLNLLGRSVKEFDSSFSAKRQPLSKQLWYLDEGKHAIVSEMKSAQKLHLIPTKDGFEELVNQANSQISSLNIQINGLNSQINSQAATIIELNEKLSSAMQTIKEKDDAYAKLMKSYKELEERVKKIPKPTSEEEFRYKVLSSLSGIESNVNIVKEQTQLKGSHHNDSDNQNADLKKWLPWGLFLIAAILCTWFAFKGVNKGDTSQLDVLRQENDSLVIANNRLNIELEKSKEAIDLLNQEQELERLNNTNEGDSHNAQTEPQKPPFLDVSGASDGKVSLGQHRINPKRMPVGAIWVVKTCNPIGCATKVDNSIMCNAAGTFTIVVKNGNEEISESARSLTIIE